MAKRKFVDDDCYMSLHVKVVNDHTQESQVRSATAWPTFTLERVQ